jgi:uncharacterized damage-inducible protein DinB
MSDWMKRQYDYHVWANEKLLRHLEELPEDVFLKPTDLGFSSISEVFGHLVSAEEVWLARLNGETPPPLSPKPFQTSEEARLYMREQQERFREYIRNIKDWETKVDYSNTKGQARSNTIIEIVLQVVNHGTYHRGNVTTILRSYGYPGTVTDYIAFVWTTDH